jgi:hypothetical protein
MAVEAGTGAATTTGMAAGTAIPKAAATAGVAIEPGTPAWTILK